MLHLKPDVSSGYATMTTHKSEQTIVVKIDTIVSWSDVPLSCASGPNLMFTHSTEVVSRLANNTKGLAAIDGVHPS